MRKLLWAALLALPVLATGQNQAWAGACYDLSGCFRVKICAAGALKCCRESFCCNQCCPGPGGGGGYGGGYGGCCGGGQDCSGNVPGPWYTFWPYSGQPYMTSPYATEGWVYDNHFQLPAPVYPYWPPNVTAAPPPPFAAPAFQPVGYYPSYWYAR
jgi:hypothetical protein